MFTNMFLLSLLTIIYGTKGDDAGGEGVAEINALHYLPDLSQQQHSDLNFMKTPIAQRSIRTPFRNTEIMTARGFGKRGDEEFGDNNEKRTRTDQQMNDDYRDETLNNRIREKPILFPFINQFVKNQEDYIDRENNVVPPVKHRLQIRDGILKFRLNDGNLRIGRSFGKRSFGTNPIVDNFRALQYFRMLSNQNQQMNSNSNYNSIRR